MIFSNIVATGGDLASSITGLPGHPVEDVTLSNLSITMRGGEPTPMRAPAPEAAGDYPQAPMFGTLPAHGLCLRHVRGLTLDDVRLTTGAPDARPPIVEEDVTRTEPAR